MKDDLDDLLATKLKDMSLEPCFKVTYFPQLDLHFLDMPGFKSYVAGPIEDVLQIIIHRLKVAEPSTKTKLT